MEAFESLPKPGVIYYGAAAVAARRGRPLIDLIELKANNSQYLFLAYTPVVHSLPGGGHEVECVADPHDGTVSIFTRTTLASLVDDSPKVRNHRRIQLHPHNTCGISFVLPGPVDPTTIEIFTRSATVFEVRLTIEK